MAGASSTALSFTTISFATDGIDESSDVCLIGERIGCMLGTRTVCEAVAPCTLSFSVVVGLAVAGALVGGELNPTREISRRRLYWMALDWRSVATTKRILPPLRTNDKASSRTFFSGRTKELSSTDWST